MSGNIKQAGRSGMLSSMLRADIRRMLKSRLFYIMPAVALLVPVIMTVMLTAMDGKETVNQQTGEVTVMEGPESVWESIGSLPSSGDEIGSENGVGEDGTDSMAGMDMLSMCNINMVFMGVAVFVCIFVCDDFRSGYAKNLFTVRAGRGEYAWSKVIVGSACGALMLICYFLGGMLGGAVSGLSFALCDGMSVQSIVMCMLSKIFLVSVFVSIFTVISICARQRTWLAICLSLGGGMLLFMTVPMITPLTAGILNVILCLGGGVLFSAGLCAVGRAVLRRVHLV